MCIHLCKKWKRKYNNNDFLINSEPSRNVRLSSVNVIKGNNEISTRIFLLDHYGSNKNFKANKLKKYFVTFIDTGKYLR